MSTLTPEIKQRSEAWLGADFDEATRKEVQQLIDANDVRELTDRFYRDLEFGTGGLRGIMGAGTNRINRYTLGMATQGLSNYLREVYGNDEISVVIAHDNRNNAETFARVVADVFTANGIRVHFFRGMRPTPELSFAIRELGARSGVMLTASHNPKEYSGYKAYWADGGQVISPHDENIIREVEKITRVSDVRFDGDDSLFAEIGEDMDRRYIDALTSVSLNPDVIRRQADIPIVFSPIHGAARDLVPRTLEAFGFTNVILVEEQLTPDGNFPTVVYPNPEEEEALTLALQKAREVGAELVMATDPDADRVGIAVKDDSGDLVLLNGNQTGCLLVQYVLDQWADQGRLTGKEYIVKTIVTSYLMDRIAAAQNVECFNVLTGFKFIGSIMTQLEGERTFIVGGEESYGYLVGEHARDKDAIVACAMIAEMAAFYRDQGRSLFEAMIDMYVQYGLFREKLISVTKKGKEGAEEIAAMMERFRTNPPESLAGSTIVTIKDYGSSKETNVRDGSSMAIDLPSSNVLQFVTEDGSIISARPSGTEPKIKFYCSTSGRLGSREEYRDAASRLDRKIDSLLTDLGVA
jgi:phosphoglucomutase